MAIAENRTAVIKKPKTVASLKKDRAYALGKRALEAYNSSHFKAFTRSEATPKVMANATAEKILLLVKKSSCATGNLSNCNW